MRESLLAAKRDFGFGFGLGLAAAVVDFFDGLEVLVFVGFWVKVGVGTAWLSSCAKSSFGAPM
jgi:hypothetical protein